MNNFLYFFNYKQTVLEINSTQRRDQKPRLKMNISLILDKKMYISQ